MKAITLFAGMLPVVAIAKQTNIVLINLDDAGYGDFSYNGAYGYQTPNIDRMAAQGMRFTHFLSAQPISGASRCGLLTGCYPNRLGFSGAPGPDAKYGVNPNEMLIPEVLKQKDYATAIFGKWHLGSQQVFLPLQNGFDEYYGLPYSNDMWPNHPWQGTVFNFPDLPTYDGNQVVGYNTDQTRLTTDYTEHAVSFIHRNRKRPFFLYVAHNMPHVPLAVSDKFKGKSKQGLYGDVMMEIDWSVGQILQELQKDGLQENTLVILTSDNGPWTNYGNHAGSAGGLREAKACTWDGGNRVPCVMYWPGTIPAGTTCNQMASHIDLLPTFAEITSCPLPPNKIDGVSILSLLKGEEGAQPRKYFVYYYNKNDLEAVTDGTYKLVFPHTYNSYEGQIPGRDGKPGPVVRRELKEMQLYDLRRDPGERYNIISAIPDVVQRLQAVADEYRQELGDNLTGAKGTGRRQPLFVK